MLTRPLVYLTALRRIQLKIPDAIEGLYILRTWLNDNKGSKEIIKKGPQIKYFCFVALRAKPLRSAPTVYPITSALSGAVSALHQLTLKTLTNFMPHDVCSISCLLLGNRRSYLLLTLLLTLLSLLALKCRGSAQKSPANANRNLTVCCKR